MRHQTYNRQNLFRWTTLFQTIELEASILDPKHKRPLAQELYALKVSISNTGVYIPKLEAAKVRANSHVLFKTTNTLSMDLETLSNITYTNYDSESTRRAAS